jgi:Zn-dependent M28 family amino/carboxypeptidase
VWGEGQAAIPAAALSAEDVDLIDRLAARGEVRMHLQLESQTLPPADSFNVIADWPGRELSNEVVVVSGHLDSWDLGTGATDDGVGVAAAAGVIDVLKTLGLHARRTIRFVAWTDEELGSKGAAAYAKSLPEPLATHCAAIEEDTGAGAPLGYRAAIPLAAMADLAPLNVALAPLHATVAEHTDGSVGADIDALRRAGVPSFEPLTDTRHYFDLHHTAADTLDKVNPADLRAQVATMSLMAYVLAESPTCIGRAAK